jgi:hypothetical protein
MRVVISAPRKSAGAQLRCLLSMAYDLKAPPVSAPDHQDSAEIAGWLAALPARSASTCDVPRSMLIAPATAAGVRLVGVIRHPFDLFVSNYDVAQQRAIRGRESNHDVFTWSVLAGEELTSDIATAYAIGDFAGEIAALKAWSTSDLHVRFEDLLDDPAAVLGSLSGDLGALSDEEITHAVGLCPAENVVKSRPGLGRRMPSVPPGAWKDRLPAGLIDVLVKHYGADVAELGYQAS